MIRPRRCRAQTKKTRDGGARNQGKKSCLRAEKATIAIVGLCLCVAFAVFVVLIVIIDFCNKYCSLCFAFIDAVLVLLCRCFWRKLTPWSMRMVDIHSCSPVL
jgi:hypothetical protein